jgi:hypothetical protein
MFGGLAINIADQTVADIRVCKEDCGCGRTATSIETVATRQVNLTFKSPPIPIYGITIRGVFSYKGGGQLKSKSGGCDNVTIAGVGCTFSQVSLGAEGCGGVGIEICVGAEYFWKHEACSPPLSIKDCSGWKVSVKACVGLGWFKKCKEVYYSNDSCASTGT